ncbi:TniQ family protein [Paenibacillus tritici]|uniref:TniQ family protein n=1 Tax=Paenibacillus tritici TaxID=1873425 RepID=UPI001BAE0153|nr:TniQ family protein [Paenibacillus tritici]QUL57049.1 TniQ family protein [Paenibacillus tritici]
MKRLIKYPKYIEGESLASYTYRLSKENRYSGITNLAKNLNCHSSQINKNEFNHSMIRKLSQLSDNPIENLESGSANTIRLMLSETLYNHMIQRHRIKYCPICILKGELRHRWYWSLYPYTVCLEHSVLLIDRCSFCQSYIGIKDFMYGKCSRCNFSYKKAATQRIDQSSIMYLTQNDLTERLFQSTNSIIFPELSIRQYLSLAYHSFYLIEGMNSFLDNTTPIHAFIQKKSREQSLENAITVYSNIFWMYSDFPSHYYHVLQAFQNQKNRHSYERKANYEEILKYPEFNVIKEAYEAYWIKQLNEGKIRKDFSVFKSNQSLLEKRYFIAREEIKGLHGFGYKKISRLADNSIIFLNDKITGSRKYYVEKESFEHALKISKQYITRREAANFLGIRKDSIPPLIKEKLLNEYKTPFSNVTQLLRSEVTGLMKRCRGEQKEPKPQNIFFHQALIKYSVVGLTIVKIIKLISEDQLEPYLKFNSDNLAGLFFEQHQLEHCISEIKKEKTVIEGYYMNDVINMLHIGEKAMKEFMSKRILLPEKVVVLKDGRERYMFNKVFIDQFIADYLNIRQASIEYRIPEIKIRRWISSGKLYGSIYRIGQKFWLKRSRIEELKIL